MADQDRVFRTIELTPGFVRSFESKQFSDVDRRRLLRALELLDENERHSSLRVHLLQGDLAGAWSAPESDEPRITFRRLDDGRKRILSCTRHYR
ncbi:MAG: hypothetical protein AVDCRST_MAG73-1384 [uncultured Thermomicrobiales bacterium]|uniref:Uncharacterized protein n=1 Tax=uncultured Thermomicrobiales bacterium TaxID=1645740 RepID=A0A6J4TZ97_9BACT|nr:MAG: hypothetical protein AVDCRST_MAG73-1384 [uncultured Thermomicrobiales bacterium]